MTFCANPIAPVRNSCACAFAGQRIRLRSSDVPLDEDALTSLNNECRVVRLRPLRIFFPSFFPKTWCVFMSCLLNETLLLFCSSSWLHMQMIILLPNKHSGKSGARPELDPLDSFLSCNSSISPLSVGPLHSLIWAEWKCSGAPSVAPHTLFLQNGQLFHQRQSWTHR